jgi:putative colanic acid biosynthesis glycosyltransferase
MLFSIVTVCYNDLNGLKLTHGSVTTQSFPDYEMIIVDGNSTDGTLEWLKKIDNPKIKWKSEPDKGIFDAMNKGLEQATGDYVIFMNSFDEFASPGVLGKISNEINKHSKNDFLFIYGDSIDITLEGIGLYKKSRSHLLNWRGLFTSHQAMLFKNNGIRFPLEYPTTSDYAYVSMYLQNAKDVNILKLDMAICKFKLGGTNETARYRALREDYQIRRQVIGLSRVKSLFLFLLHFVHTFLKRNSPGLTRKLRYRGQL